MHRTIRVPGKVFGGVLLALLLSGIPMAPAQEQVPAPLPAAPGATAPTIVVPINGTQNLRMTTGKNLARVFNRTDTVARVSHVVDRPNEVLITGLEPGITRITMTDVDGKEESYDVVVQMNVEYLRTLLKRGVPTANIEIIPSANNTVILQGNVARAEDIDSILRIVQSVVLSPDRIINRLRVGGVVQVQLDVTVARVSRSELRQMGFTFQNIGQRHLFAGNLDNVGNAVAASQTTSVSSTIGSGGGSSAAAGAASLIGGPANLFYGVISDKQSFFGYLQALKDERIVKLLAEPKLVTLSGRPASFLSGGEQAVPVPAGLGQIGVQFEEFGTRLNFLPIVLGEGRIHLEVEPEVSNLDPAAGVNIQGTTVPGRVTQRVHTTVELETGQTFVIGGLIQRNVRGTVVKVPIAGEIPFVGVFFSRKRFEEVEEELVVLVTPYLVDALACNQVPKLLPGQETRSPDDFELFLEGILEAPRGQRFACQDGRYVPAFKVGPTSELFPCYGCNDGSCGPAAQPSFGSATGTAQPANHSGARNEAARTGAMTVPATGSSPSTGTPPSELPGGGGDRP